MSDNLIEALQDLTCEMEKLSEVGRLSNESIADFTRVCDEWRLKFEATLTDEERVEYHQRMSEGFGFMDAAQSVFALRYLRRSS